MCSDAVSLIIVVPTVWRRLLTSSVLFLLRSQQSKCSSVGRACSSADLSLWRSASCFQAHDYAVELNRQLFAALDAPPKEGVFENPKGDDPEVEPEPAGTWVEYLGRLAGAGTGIEKSSVDEVLSGLLSEPSVQEKADEASGRPL